MKAEDMGIDPENGKHSRDMTRAETAMIGVLSKHVGKHNKIPAEDLAIEWREHMGHLKVTYTAYHRLIDGWKRNVRSMVNHLVIDHDQPIFSAAGVTGGYWASESKEEGKEFYETFRRRGMTGLTKAARGNQAVLVDMVKQIAFTFDELKSARPAGEIQDLSHKLSGLLEKVA